MKKLFLIFTLVFITLFISKINAQELPNYQMYLQNGYLYNPAFVIAEQNYTAYLNTHLQWVGFSGAPRINSFGFSAPYNKKIGLGINLVTKKHGVMNTQQGMLSYAYKGKIDRNQYFLLGLSGGIKNDRIDNSRIVGEVDLSDPSIVSSYYNKVFFAGAIGAAYYYKNFEAQLAIPNLLARDAAKLYTMGIFAYNYKIDGDVWNLKPSIMLSGTPITPYLIEGNFTTEWNKLLWLQLGYRSTNALTFGVGFNFKDYQLGYSYRDDYNDMGMASAGSHEIQLIARFHKRLKERPINEREEFLIAKYKGTVVNTIDNMPVNAEVIFFDEFGRIIYQTKADDQGKYTANLDINKKYKIEVKAPGFTTYEKVVSATKRTTNTINFRIKPSTKTLKGRCNAPNALIAIYDENNTLLKTVSADPVGNYTVLLESDKNYKLDVTADGYAPMQKDFKMPSDKMESVVDLNLNAIVQVPGSLKYKYSDEIVSATIKITDQTGKEVQNLKVLERFEIQMAEGKYKIEISGENIITLKDSIVITKANAKDCLLGLEVNQLKKDKTFSLGVVTFTQGTALLTVESYRVLDELVKIMNDNPDMKIEIDGHTDNSGDAATNLILSKQRAQECKNYAVNKGIDKNRLTVVGYGQMKPIVPNTTPENRAKNRRVEFKVVKKFTTIMEDD